MFEEKKVKPTPRHEQETIITYDKFLDEWHLYTNNPTHARKWEDTAIAPGIKYYHEDTGVLIAIDAVIDGTASIRRKREMTAEQKRIASERFKEIRQKKKSEES